MIEHRTQNTERRLEACPTTSVDRLLLSTDGSEFSEGAIKEAINIAKRCSSKLYVLSVIEFNPEYEALAPQLIEKAERETRQHLESVKERASKEGIECEIIAHQGEEPYRYIIEEAEKNKVGMIIMGRRGRTGLKRLMMGSVTARVVGHATRNILVVPRAAHIKWGNIVIATDGSKYSEAAAREALSLAKNCRSNVYAIAVTRSDATEESRISENALREIKSAAERENIKVDTSLVKVKPHESINEAILGYAREKDADIIVMGSHGRTGIQRLLIGSVAERVIGHTNCAVMVVKA